jgi:CheY-like chemotaxis protein
LSVDREVGDVVLQVDQERLSQVFSNLLSNAAKYSDKGTPIRMVLGSCEGALSISVIDQGIGISREQQDWIFELFAQVDTSLERARGGLGIGLTLSRTIVEMHGGELNVESPGLHQGSRFTVHLPASRIVVDEVATELAAAKSTTTCRVLIVDDNADAADSLAMILDLLGHTTRSVTDPFAAVDAARTFTPDVIFLDIGMPGMSGYDVARALRSDLPAATAKLVALTGWGQPEDRRRSQEAGFDYHLVKPAALASIEAICKDVAARATADDAPVSTNVSAT